MRDDGFWDRRGEAAARISRRIMAEGVPRPGLRLAADGKSLIPCRRHWWVWVLPTVRKCQHCGHVEQA